MNKAIAVALHIGWLASPAAAADTVPVALRALDGTQVTLAVELAITPAERLRGLMGRRAMATGHAMLFDFEQDGNLVMWMKDTLFPLDLVFVTASGEVVHVIERTTPLSETFLPTPVPARYVIELNAGEAARRGLAPGARLALPLKARVTSP